MKKITLPIILIIFSLIIAACGSTTSQSGFQRSGSNQTRTLTPEMQLAVGTFKLEGTNQAVDSKMAAQLLPLWQLLKQLNSSSSAAPQEVTAVVNQIQSTMTPSQVNTIHNMQLTQRDVFTVMQAQGLLPAGGSGFASSGSGNGTNSSSNGSSSNRNRGGFGGGGGFGGPGGFVFVQPGTSTSTTSTQQRTQQQFTSFASQTSTTLIDGLIKLLESKV